MRRKLCSVLLLVLMSLLTFNQSDLTTSYLNINETDEQVITAENFISDITATHITAPSTLPTNKIQVDSVLPVVSEPVDSVIMIVKQFYFVSHKTESDGFVNKKQYQSSYLS